MNVKFLVLHGYRNCGNRLQHQMMPLIKTLSKKSVLFDFIHSNILYEKIEGEVSPSEDELKKFGPYLKWWTTDRIRLLTQRDYDTWKESVNQVEKYLELHPEINGILGFSQGSSLLQMLPSLAKMKHVILVGGIPVYENKETDLLPYRHSNTLHIIGEADPVVSPAASQNLAALFPTPQIYIHKGKHYVPTNGEACRKILSYLNLKIT